MIALYKATKKKSFQNATGKTKAYYTDQRILQGPKLLKRLVFGIFSTYYYRKDQQRTTKTKSVLQRPIAYYKDIPLAYPSHLYYTIAYALSLAYELFHATRTSA